MKSSADNLIRKCEAAIARGAMDDARKLSVGVSILTGQPAWQRAYQVLIDHEDISGFIDVDSVDIPQWLPSFLHDLHDTRGEEFKNQSARNGTQVNLTGNQDIAKWLGESRIIGVWTTRLGRGGFHVNHIHPRGENSHVIYIEAPDKSSGHLQFGVTRFGQYEPMKTIIPQEGMKISFPCWLWHGVTQYNGEKPRLTVAFDTKA